MLKSEVEFAPFQVLLIKMIQEVDKRLTFKFKDWTIVRLVQTDMKLMAQEFNKLQFAQGNS